MTSVPFLIIIDDTLGQVYLSSLLFMIVLGRGSWMKRCRHKYERRHFGQRKKHAELSLTSRLPLGIIWDLWQIWTAGSGGWGPFGIQFWVLLISGPWHDLRALKKEFLFSFKYILGLLTSRCVFFVCFFLPTSSWIGVKMQVIHLLTSLFKALWTWSV